MRRFKVEQQYTDESDRNPFDRQSRIAWWDQDAVRNANILVIGAGAIGNEVLKNLALMGVGGIHIADMDTISYSNLSRTVLFRSEDVGQPKATVAARRTSELHLDPTSLVTSFVGDIATDLGTGIFRRMNLVLGCVDNVETRIAVNRECRLAGVPWIDAGIRELGARISVYAASNGACYECNLGQHARTAARERLSCDEFKRRSAEASRVPTIQVSSALVAAIQSQEAMKLICGHEVAFGRSLYFQGLTNDLVSYGQSERDDCASHVAYHDIVGLPARHSDTIATFLTTVDQHLHLDQPIDVDLSAENFAFVRSSSCRGGCGTTLTVMRPRHRVYVDELYCENCALSPATAKLEDGALLDDIVYSISSANSDDELLRLTLADVGFGLGDIVTVTDGATQHFIELAADVSDHLSRHTTLPSIA